MRCCLYARCSTSAQADKELSIPAQLAECRKYASEKGWEIVKEYADAGLTGTNDDRPFLQEMFEAVKLKQFDVILAWRGNRLFRSVEHRLAYRRILRRYNVRFVSLHEPEYEGASGQFMEIVMAAADEMYSHQVAEDTLRGLKQIARAGFSAGGRPPVGYRNIKKAVGLKPNGEPIMRTAYQPDDNASLVKKVFEMYASGKTGPQIIKETGIVSARNNLSAMLHNRAYIGERVYFQTRRADKKSIRLKNNEDDIIRVENAHEAIISPGLFERVQDILRRKRPRLGQLRVSANNYVLSGLLWCKKHDKPYGGNGNGVRLYYSCAARMKSSRASADCDLLRKEPIEKAVIDALREDIIDRPRIRAGLEHLRRERILAAREDTGELLRLKAELKQLELELSRFHSAIAQGLDPSTMIAPLHLREGKKKLLLADIKYWENKKAEEPLFAPVSDEEVEQAVSHINKILSGPDLKMTLAQFIERVEVDGGDLTLYYTFTDPKAWGKNGDPDGLYALHYSIKLALPSWAVAGKQKAPASSV
jgi:DNA invertase Pin-like site-specific DNA recombinase